MIPATDLSYVIVDCVKGTDAVSLLSMHGDISLAKNRVVWIDSHEKVHERKGKPSKLLPVLDTSPVESADLLRSSMS